MRRAGRARWQLGGRLIARELESTHVLIRTGFDARDVLLKEHPEVFSVPARFARHMMVVAELGADTGDADAGGSVEGAVRAAWLLQQT